MDNSLRKWRITHYSNKIGLYDTGKQTFINQSGDVVLSFPYKDCILEWGMSDEESGREEKFFHETIDRADIDTLRDPKVLTQFERIDKDGIHTIMSADEIDFFDMDGNLIENLLIKGNNLIALYSLRQRLTGKVKLIYIDPPYNTGSDGFKYNDSFNHSTWLVFMRNRLEVARDLLREDGVIFVQCDDNEQAYLKVLMDEVFWRLNFVENFMWLHWKWKKDKNSRTLQQYALCYGKNEALLESWNVVKKANYTFTNPDNDPRGPWFSWSVSFSEDRSNIHHDNYFSIKSPTWVEWTRQWMCDKDEMDEYLKNNKIYFWQAPKFDNVPRLRIFPDNEDDIIPPNIFDNHWTTRSAKKELKELWFNPNDFDTPKPEKLLESIIEMTTWDSDIILDFCLWSWTTSAVAHKMGRRWIGMEQMGYIENIAKVRLQKVVEWERGGISKSVDWQWGGDFVYMELKTYNIEFIYRIESARTKEELYTIYVEMARNAFLKFWFDKRDFEREGYTALPLEEQKLKLRELLDMNQLYLNVGDMDDTRHEISPLEKSLTEKFYGKE